MAVSLAKKKHIQAFNHINFNLYHYAGNNPVKYVDPDGNEDFLSYLHRMLKDSYGNDGADYIFRNDPSLKFACTVDAAAKGDVSAQTQIKYAFHEASREMLGEVSEKSAYASIAFLAVGCPEGAAVCGWVSTGADAILAIDDLLQGNYERFGKEAVITVAGIITPKVIEKGVTAYSETIKITVGSTGRYYEVGHRGAIKSEKALRKILSKDIADGYFGKEVIPNTPSIIEQAVKAYKELNGDDNE